MLAYHQKMLIVEKLTGRDLGGLRLDEFDEPWRAIWGRVEPVNDRDLAERELWKAAEGLEGRNELVEELLGMLPSAETFRRFRSMAEIAEDLPPVAWLWPGWIPRGLLSLLGAAPGAGKSMVALDLAKRLVHDEGFPDEAPVPCAGAPVIYVDAEAVPQIQNERAVAWGMDRSRLYPMLPPEAYGMLDLGEGGQQDRLVEMVHWLEPGLVVVDSLSSITVRGENNVEDVRAILRFLAAVAGEWNVAVLLIHHLRKRGKGLPMMDVLTADDFRGSSHIIAMARSVMGLSIVQDGPEPDRNGPRRLEVLKTNLVRHPSALGVVFEDRPPSVPRLSATQTGLGGGKAGAPVLRYTSAPKAFREPTQAEECAVWLVEVLEEAGEPMKPKEIVKMAKEMGFSRGVVYRAREQLAGVVVDSEPRRHPDNRWNLIEGRD